MVSGGWEIFGIFLIKDFKVFIRLILSRFRRTLLLFVVERDGLLVGVEQFCCK